MSIKRLVFWIVMLAVFAMSARISVDTDTWWHLRAGQWIVENRAVPQADPFSHTRAGEPWQYPGWLVEAPMYGIYRAFGPGGLNVWTAAMVTLAFAFLWGTLTGGPFLRAFVIVLAATVSGVFWAARPYLISFVLAAVYLWILEDFRWERSAQAWRRLWWLPVLMVLWVNSHGGFAVGFLLWGVYLFFDLLARLLRGSLFADLHALIKNPRSAIRNPQFTLWWVGPLMVLAVCLNPSGPLMLAYPLKTVSIGALQEHIQEWQSPDFHQLHVQPFAWLLLLTFGVVGASRRRLALTDFLLVAGFAYMGLLAGRNIALFALASPPVLTRHAAPLLDALGDKFGWRGVRARPVTRRQGILNGLVLAVLALAVMVKVVTVFPASVNEEAFQESLPVEAVTYIREGRPAGELFNSYNWGGYLIWALPEYAVFVDGRTDLYDDEVLGEWIQVMRVDEGWEQTLDKYGVNLILIESGATLDRALAREAGWTLAYADDRAVVYLRALP